MRAASPPSLTTAAARRDGWRRYVAGGRRDDALRNALIEAELPALRKLVFQCVRRLPNAVQVDELLGAAAEGLLQAARTYDPDEPATFATYSYPRARGAMLDELRGRDLLPRSLRQVQRRCAEFAERFAHAEGRPPTLDEIAAATGYDAQRLWLAHVSTASLDEVVLQICPRATTLGELQPAPPVDNGGRERRAAVDELCRGLSRRERSLVRLYYLGELSMKEIGRLHRISESRVSQRQ